MKPQVASSKTRLRFIVALKVKSKLSSVLPASLSRPVSVQQSIAAPREFVRHEARDQVNRRHRLGLGLVQARFQHGGHASEAKLPQRTL